MNFKEILKRKFKGPSFNTQDEDNADSQIGDVESQTGYIMKEVQKK